MFPCGSFSWTMLGVPVTLALPTDLHIVSFGLTHLKMRSSWTPLPQGVAPSDEEAIKGEGLCTHD